MAVANIHRPGALTPSMVLSLGLGIALLVTVIEIDGNLRRQFTRELPAKAPSFYFLDIPSAQASQFTAFLHKEAPSAKLEDVPMLRGRIVSANGIAADKLKPADDARWVLQSDRGITYADKVPEGSRLVAGEWWKPGYDGPPLVSFEQHIAEGLGLKLGDPVTVNVLGPQHHRQDRQPAPRRLAEPEHQFRHGVLAEHLPRRAAHPHRHPHLPQRRHARRRRRACCARRRRAIPWSPRCG